MVGMARYRSTSSLDSSNISDSNKSIPI